MKKILLLVAAFMLFGTVANADDEPEPAKNYPSDVKYETRKTEFTVSKLQTAFGTAETHSISLTFR